MTEPVRSEPVVLVVSYRRADLLRRCLDSVRKHLPDSRILVWDNRSTASDEIRRLAGEYPEAEWEFAARNAGFAAAVNKLAERVPGEDLLLLNPDAELTGPLARCRAALAGTRVAALSPTVSATTVASAAGSSAEVSSAAVPPAAADDRPRWDVAHRHGTVVRELVSYAGYADRLRGSRISPLYAEPPSDVDGYLTGCCLLISGRAWQELGPFDAARYYLYGEEAAWQQNARRRGWRLLLVDEPEVRHGAGGTVAGDPLAARRAADLLRAGVVQRLGLHGNAGPGAYYSAGARVLELAQRSKRALRRQTLAAAAGAARQGRPSILLTSNQLRHGGAERQRVLLANELAARGYPVTLACLQFFGELTEELDPAVRLVLTPWWQPSVDLPAGDAVLITGITNTEAGFAIGWRAATALRSGRHRWLAATHEPAEPERSFYGSTLAAAIRRSDGVLALSPRHRADVDRMHHLHDRYFLAPNGAAEPGTNDNGYRPRRPLRLGVLCRMVEHKNPHLLVAALATMPELAWTLDLFGDGPDRERLAAMTPPEVADRVRWRGSSPGPDDAFADIDLLCMPGRLEAFPMVIIEAMVRGRPVVASAVASVPDMLDDGRAGVLVDPVTVDAWAAALRPILTDPAGLTGIAEAGRRRAAELYTVDAMVDAYERAIAEVL